jgi:uncharacterized membrane protein YsdA (DUF1294 family)
MLPLAVTIPAFLLVINLASCAAFVLDRQAAAYGRARIRPSFLMLFLSLGGGFGMLLAIAPSIRSGLLPSITTTMLTVLGLQVGIAAGILAFFVLPAA